MSDIRFVPYVASPPGDAPRAEIDEWMDQTLFIHDDLDLLLRMPHDKYARTPTSWCFNTRLPLIHVWGCWKTIKSNVAQYSCSTELLFRRVYRIILMARFWCQVVFDESLHSCIDSYLRLAPRSSADISVKYAADVHERQQTLHKYVYISIRVGF